MKTVLIIAYECRPFNRPASNIGAQRAFQFAKWLPKYGWKAIVLCSEYDKRRSLTSVLNKEIEDQIENAIAQNKGEQSIIIPLATPKKVGFWDSIWMNQFIKTSSGAFEPKKDGNKWVRKLATLIKLFKGDYSADFQEVGKIALSYLVNTHKIDAIISEHGPDAGLHLASWANGKFKIPWVADFRDPYLQPFEGAQKLFAGIAIKNLIKSASCTINVNEHISELDHQVYKLPAYTITNGYDPEEVLLIPEMNKQLETLIFFYPGQIYLPYQEAEPFFEFLSILKSANCNFKFIYCGVSETYVKQMAAKYNLESFVEVYGLLPKEKVNSFYHQADVLPIFSMQKLDNIYYSQGLLPGKFLEYLGIKKPVLNITNLNSMLEKTMVSLEMPLLFNNPQLAANFFLDRSNDQIRAIKTSKNIDQFSRPYQAGQLAEILNSL